MKTRIFISIACAFATANVVAVGTLSN